MQWHRSRNCLDNHKVTKIYGLFLNLSRFSHFTLVIYYHIVLNPVFFQILALYFHLNKCYLSLVKCCYFHWILKWNVNTIIIHYLHFVFVCLSWVDSRSSKYDQMMMIPSGHGLFIQTQQNITSPYKIFDNRRQT